MIPTSLPVVELLGKPDCHLCHEAQAVLHALQAQGTFPLREIDITTDPTLWAHYHVEIPVVLINGRKVCKYRIDPQQFLRALQRAASPRWRRFWPRI
jgi:glutaredoxin